MNFNGVQDFFDYFGQVDLDMKLRTCRGSCRLAQSFSVDHGGYEPLQTDRNFKDQTVRQAAPPANTPQINLEPADVGLPSTEYRTIPAVQRELLTHFEDIGVNRFALEFIESAETGVSGLPDQNAPPERL